MVRAYSPAAATRSRRWSHGRARAAGPAAPRAEDSSALIWSWTLSRPLTEPARLSRARSWVIAACADVTRLFTSATSPVTSCACWDSAAWLPSVLDSWRSVAPYAATGILSCRLTVARAWSGRVEHGLLAGHVAAGGGDDAGRQRGRPGHVRRPHGQPGRVDDAPAGHDQPGRGRRRRSARPALRRRRRRRGQRGPRRPSPRCPADPLTVAEPCREEDAPKEADPEVPPEHPASSRLAPEIAAAMPSAVTRAPVREGKARTLVFMLVGRTRRAPGSGLGDNRRQSR